MPGKSKSSNKGSDNSLLASLLHDRERKLFGGTSGEQDLGDSSVVQQNQEFSINSEEFPSLPGSEGLGNASPSNLTTNTGSGNPSVQGENQPSSSVLQQASPGIGNRNAVQGLSAPQNLENANRGSNLATNRGPGNVSVQGKNQLSGSALQKGSSSGGPSSQSHVPTVNSPNSKGWFYDKSSNTIFSGCLDDYFPSADPPVPVQGLQEQQDPLQSESSSSHQQGQQQVLAVSTGGTKSSSSVNAKGAGGSIPGVLQASASSGYRNAVVQGLGVPKNFENAGPQITGGNISGSISSDVLEQNQLASGALQLGSCAGGPISQSQVQAVNDSFLPNLGDGFTSACSPECVRRHQGQSGLEATFDVQQNQEFNIEATFRFASCNADNSTNSSGKEKVQDNTMPTIPPQHTPMSRTIEFSSGESSSSHSQLTIAVSAAGSKDEQPRNRLLGYNLSDLSQRESSSSHQKGQQQVPAVSTGGTSSSVNSQDLLQNTNGAGGLENAGPQATSSEGNTVSGGNMSRSISSGGESLVQEHNQLMIGVLQQGSPAGGPISQSQVEAVYSPNSMRMSNDVNSIDFFLSNLSDDFPTESPLERARRLQGQLDSLQKGFEATFNIQDENLPGYTGNADHRADYKLQKSTMPTMPPQHIPMSRTVGFSFGESSSTHHPPQLFLGASSSSVNSQDLHSSEILPTSHSSYHSQTDRSPNTVGRVGSYSEQPQKLLEELLAIDQKFRNQAAQPRPEPYGLLGLVDIMKRGDPLALGIDIDTLGLNLNSKEDLFPMFESPFYDEPVQRDILPEFYNVQQLHGLIRGHYQNFVLETLFYIYYGMQNKQARLYAAYELCKRGWFYHKGHKSWFKRCPDVPLQETHTCATGSFFCFDLGSFTLIRKDDFVVEYTMLDLSPGLL